MTTYAREINNVALDVTTSDPAISFHPDLASFFISVPDGTENGAIFKNGIWINPAPIETTPLATAVPTVSPIKFKMLWTSQERVAIKALRVSDAIVDDFMELVNDPQLTEVVMSLESVQNAIWYTLAGLAAAHVIAPEDIAVRHAAISSGVLQ